MSRRQFTIPAAYVSRFNRAADAGPAEGRKARQGPIWQELALVLGFDAATAEPTSAETPRLFTAEVAPTPVTVDTLGAIHGERVRCLDIVTDVLSRAIPGCSPHEAIRLTMIGVEMQAAIGGAGYAMAEDETYEWVTPGRLPS